MFTILWKCGNGVEELYPDCGPVTYYPPTNSKEDECEGREHIAFQNRVVTANEAAHFVRSVIDTGTVYVMNDAGKTVGTHILA